MKERMKKHGKELERPNQIQQQKGRRKSTANENNETAVRDWDEEREKILNEFFFFPGFQVQLTFLLIAYGLTYVYWVAGQKSNQFPGRPRRATIQPVSTIADSELGQLRQSKWP